MTILLDLMRHGEAEGGRAYRGHGVDDPLSDKGWWQMSARVDHYCPWTHIISSPMKRCRAFAEELAGRHGLPMVIEDRFKEVGFGRWEGKTPDEIIAQWPEEYSDFYRDPVNCRPEGAEPLDAFYARVGAAMADVVNGYEGRHVLVVAHAGVIRAALTNAMNAAPGCMYRIRIPYAAMSRLSYDEKGWSVEFVNGQLTE
jgi:alpha-ribazole phosphatase